jgi:hypothetical protein
MAAAVRIGAGAVVWALHFAFVYGATAYGCARGLDARAPIIVATVLALAAAASIFVRAWPAAHAFTRWLAAGLAATAMLAVAWEAIATLLSPGCR